MSGDGNMKTVKEVSKISGVSVRTLHYYDSIGLLKPTKITEAGYRLYDDNAISKLQTILMYKHLEFSLSDIKNIMENPDYDLAAAVKQQKNLLILQKKRLNKLISLADDIIEKGSVAMNFFAFDKSEIENYTKEVKERWGETQAYNEFSEKEIPKNAEQGLMDKMTEFGKLKTLSPDCEDVQDAVKGLQKYITDNFYTCTNEILAGLGQMYVADERFKNNIDTAGGEGTAEFISKSIAIYCKK